MQHGLSFVARVMMRAIMLAQVGDVCGVGPEIILKTLAPDMRAVHRLARFVVVGIPERMEWAVRAPGQD